MSSSEKFGRRRLRVGYGEQTVHETKQNADAFETPTLLDDLSVVCKVMRMKTTIFSQQRCV